MYNNATEGTRGWLILAILAPLRVQLCHRGDSRVANSCYLAPLRVQLSHRGDSRVADSCYLFMHVHPPDILGSGIGTLERTTMPQLSCGVRLCVASTFFWLLALPRKRKGDLLLGTQATFLGGNFAPRKWMTLCHIGTDAPSR